jgi:hypothetical protein
MDEHSDFKDRKGLLVFFGVVKLLFGVVAFLFFLLILFSLVFFQNTNIAGTQQNTVGTVIPAALIYLVLGTIFIILGVGSIKKTRWARSLTLLFSWMAFITGIVVTILMAFLINDIFNNVDSAISQNPTLLFFVKIFIFVFYILFLIIIPGIFILVYQSRNVIKTVQKYDPKERWTDKCPLPLLALCFILLYGSLSPLFMVSTGYVIPFFGTILSGLPAVILHMANSIICIYLAIQIYKLNIHAWYYSLYFFMFWVISSFVTFLFNDLMDIYHHMNISPDQLKVLENMGFFTTKNMILMCTPVIIISLLFLLYIKRFFKIDEQYETAAGQ